MQLLTPQKLNNKLLLTRSLTDNIKLINTYFVCYTYYTLYSYNKAGEKNDIKKIIRKRKYIYSTIFIYWKKSACKWTHAVQTLVVQGSAVHMYSFCNWLPCQTLYFFLRFPGYTIILSAPIYSPFPIFLHPNTSFPLFTSLTTISRTSLVKCW